MAELLQGIPSYILAIAATAAIYAILCLGLNIVWGFAGLINLGMVGFFAVGAYASAIATVTFKLPILAGLVIAMIATGLFSALVTIATLRLRGDYLAIVTLGFAELVRLVANNESWLANGSDGISNIPGPWRAEVSAGVYNLIFCAIAFAALGLCYSAAERLRASPFGRALRAIREDEEAAAAAGKPLLAFKLKAFITGSMMLGLAGGLYAHFISYFSPENVRPLLTIYIFLALTLGGTANNRGAVAGAFLLMLFLEGSRFLGHALPGLKIVQQAALREMLIGLLLILVMRLRPQGLFPEPLPKFRNTKEANT